MHPQVLYTEIVEKFPFKEDLQLEPLNFYGQTKLMNEKIANFSKEFTILRRLV